VKANEPNELNELNRPNSGKVDEKTRHSTGRPGRQKGVIHPILAKIAFHLELRGFAPIGILECWNTGILGLKGVLFLFLFFTSFQYSIIPALLIDFATKPINSYNVNRL